MNFIYSFFAYIIITFVCAALWHMVLFKKVYDRLGVFTRQKPIIPLGISSMILQGLVLAYLAPIFINPNHALLDGIIFGIISIGIFMGSNAVLAEAGKNEVGSLSTWIIIETSYYLIQGLLVGVALGLINSI